VNISFRIWSFIFVASCTLLQPSFAYAGSSILQIVSGAHHTCVLVSEPPPANSSVQCWGYNDDDQLGNSTLGRNPSRTPVPVIHADGSKVTGVTALAAGQRHTCALMEDTSVMCWGSNADGQLSNDSVPTRKSGPIIGYVPSPVPVVFSGTRGTTKLIGVRALAAGAAHTCAILAEPFPSDSSVACWGSNLYGQLSNDGLGTGEDVIVNSPVAVIFAETGGATKLTGISALAAGGGHTCARLMDSSIACWGWNKHGQLGNGSTNDSNSPVAVGFLGLAGSGSFTKLTGTINLRAGGEAVDDGNEKDGSFTCSLLHEPPPLLSSIACWGDNDNAGGELSNDTVGDYSSTPVAVVFGGTGGTLKLTGVKDLSVSTGYACAILGDTSVACWGSNVWGQLGNDAVATGIGSHSNSPVPVVYTGGSSKLTGATMLATAANHACAVVAPTLVMCWGDIAGVSSRIPMPVQITPTF